MQLATSINMREPTYVDSARNNAAAGDSLRSRDVSPARGNVGLGTFVMTGLRRLATISAIGSGTLASVTSGSNNIANGFQAPIHR